MLKLALLGLETCVGGWPVMALDIYCTPQEVMPIARLEQL